MDLRSSEVEAMVGEQGRAAEPRPKRGQPIILHNVGGVSSSASNFTLTDLWRGQALPKSTDELSVCLAQRVPQLLHSRQYYYFCAFMILINLAMVIWVVLNWGAFPESWIFALLELSINVVFTVEIMLKVSVIGRAYFFSFWGWFDVVTVVLCYLSLLIYTLKFLDTLVVIALVARYASQMLRMFVMLKNQQHHAFADELDLSKIKVIIEPEDSGSGDLGLGFDTEAQEV